MLLAQSRQRGGIERVWIKSEIVEHEIGNVDKERKLLEEGLKRFPYFLKMLGQLNDCIGQPEAAGEMCEKVLLCLQLPWKRRWEV